MPRRIDLGRAVLFGGSALLFVSLFLAWYQSGPDDITAWQAFEALDLVLAGLAVAGMVAALRPDVLPPWAGISIPAAALLIVFVQLVNQPPAAAGADLASGAWIALAGTLLMAAGAALSLAAISVTVQVAERDLRRRVPAVDRRHATDEELAEDLDADAPDAPDAAPRERSLFGGLGLHRDRVDEDDTTAAPAVPPAGAPGPASGISSAGAGDLERTQPLSAIPDEDAEADRPERP